MREGVAAEAVRETDQHRAGRRRTQQHADEHQHEHGRGGDECVGEHGRGEHDLPRLAGGEIWATAFPMRYGGTPTTDVPIRRCPPVAVGPPDGQSRELPQQRRVDLRVTVHEGARRVEDDRLVEHHRDATRRDEIHPDRAATRRGTGSTSASAHARCRTRPRGRCGRLPLAKHDTRRHGFDAYAHRSDEGDVRADGRSCSTIEAGVALPARSGCGRRHPAG